MAYGVKVSVLFPPGKDPDFMIAEAHRLAERHQCVTEGKEWEIDEQGEFVAVQTLGACDEEIGTVTIEWIKEVT